MTLTLDTAVDDVRAADVSFEPLRARLTGSRAHARRPASTTRSSRRGTSPSRCGRPPSSPSAPPRTSPQTVRFAGAHGLTVGVQATGHGAERSLAGHLLIVTKGLDEVTVHPEGWARVGAGVKWLRGHRGRRAATASPALNGSTSDVGIVGYTTGGGVGPLARTYGIAADRVRAFDVVTGDGVFRRVTPDRAPRPVLRPARRQGRRRHRDRGRVRPDPPADASTAGRSTSTAPTPPPSSTGGATGPTRCRSRRTTSFVLFQLPPLPEIPPPLAGRMTLGVRFLWTGDPEEGARLLDEIRAVAPVILDDAALQALHRDRLGARRPGRPDAGRRPGDPAERLPGRGGRAAARRRRPRVGLAAGAWSRCGSSAGPTPGRPSTRTPSTTGRRSSAC